MTVISTIYFPEKSRGGHEVMNMKIQKVTFLKTVSIKAQWTLIAQTLIKTANILQISQGKVQIIAKAHSFLIKCDDFACLKYIYSGLE